MNQTAETKPEPRDASNRSAPAAAVDPCVKAHDAEQSRSSDEDEACFDSVR